MLSCSNSVSRTLTIRRARQRSKSNSWQSYKKSSSNCNPNLWSNRPAYLCVASLTKMICCLIIRWKNLWQRSQASIPGNPSPTGDHLSASEGSAQIQNFNSILRRNLKGLNCSELFPNSFRSWQIYPS